MNPDREGRIKALAQEIHEETGSHDQLRNWYLAASFIDSFPSHDFQVIRFGKNTVIQTKNFKGYGVSWILR